MKATVTVRIAALAFVSWRLADVERQRYAAVVGMCPGTITLIDPVCLASAEPRDGMIWNFAYGVMP